MKSFIHFLQNPLIKIFLSPLAYVAFGTIIGISSVNQTRWLPLILLAVIVIISEVINHFFHLKFDRQEADKAPNFILYTLEIVLIVLFLIFAFNSVWILSLLLLLYIAYIHLQYIPFNFSASLPQLVLSVLFNAFILNIVAFYSQTLVISPDFLWQLVPLVILQFSISLQMMNNRYLIVNRRSYPYLSKVNYIVFILGLIALGSGIYYSLPSQSFYLVQILFFIISGLGIIPFLVETSKDTQLQNKINYIHAVSLIFTILYSLSVLY